MHVQSGHVTQRCHNSLRWEKGLQSANYVTHRKRMEDFGRFLKSQLVELIPTSEEDGWLSLARRDLGQVSHEMGSRWKSQNRKIVPLSPYVEKPLNSKVMKSFVPELRSRYLFFVIRDSYDLSLWTFDVRFTHNHIMAMVHRFPQIQSGSTRESPTYGSNRSV